MFKRKKPFALVIAESTIRGMWVEECSTGEGNIRIYYRRADVSEAKKIRITDRRVHREARGGGAGVVRRIERSVGVISE